LRPLVLLRKDSSFSHNATLHAAADARSAGVGRYGQDRNRSPEVIMLREAERTSGDEWRRRESNPRNVPHA
jgi:hypothetical protein